MKFNSEDLPDPEHPIIAHACFLWNVPLTFLKICFFSKNNIEFFNVYFLKRLASGIKTMVEKESTDKVYDINITK